MQQYYHILHHSPGLVFRFYQDISKLGRPEEDGSMGITTTMQVSASELIFAYTMVHVLPFSPILILLQTCEQCA